MSKVSVVFLPLAQFTLRSLAMWNKLNFKTWATKVLLLFAICYNLYHLLIGIQNPLRELEHGFLIKEVFRLDYETPILGPDWRIPIEFASYQYSVSLIVKLFNTPLDISGPTSSIFYFYVSLFLLFFILQEFKFDPNLNLLCLVFVLLNPIYCLWPRAFLYETTAIIFSLAYLLFSVKKSYNSHRYRCAVLALFFGAIAAPTKITTFAPYSFFLVFLFTVLNHIKGGFSFKYWHIALPIILFVPYVASTLWNGYADSFKTNLNIAYQLSTFLHFNDWVIWNWEGRTSLITWQKIISESMFFVKLFPFFLLLYKLKYWKHAMVCFVFWWIGSLLFTRLYYVHSYYNVANGFFLAGFIGFTVCGIMETSN